MGASRVLSLLSVLGTLSTLASAAARDDSASKACEALKSLYPDQVAFPGSDQYAEDIAHSILSSQQNSTCSIEPSGLDELVAAFAIITKDDIRAPFAVKSGGHAYNPGHSSTPGVQISMANFNETTYDASSQTAKIGTGLIWDEVYAFLEPLGRTVAGGRVSGIGVGGFSLGGGYSWISNQVGLAIDTVIGYDILLPDGTSQFVTNDTNPDLFFALRGGLNNFGIVTAVTLQTFEQEQIFGGFLIYNESNTDAFSVAVAEFLDNYTDPKAQIITTYSYTGGQFFSAILMYYDGPTPPEGLFDGILAVPAASGGAATQNFTQLLPQAGNGDIGIGPFGWAAHTVPITKYPLELLREMANQTLAYGQRLQSQHAEPIAVSISPEPFLNPFTHSKGGAYPHSPDRELSPSAPFIGYATNASIDFDTQQATRATFIAELKSYVGTIQAKAISLGVSDASDILYPNYALQDTPLELLYGDNLPQLKVIAAKYDPERKMALTGGFKFQ